MEITEVRIRKLFDDEKPIKAILSVTIDNLLVIHDIKVINAAEKFFIVMPSRKNPDGTFRDIVHPISREGREMMESVILKAYNEAVENGIEQPKTTEE